MNARKHNLVNVAATVVLATILVCIGLFWARWLCRIMRADLLPRSAREATIYPAGSVKSDEGADPNLLAPPRVTASMPAGDPLLMGLGALHYLSARVPGLPAGSSERDHVYRWSLGPDSEQLYFDPSLGLIIRKGTERIRRDDGTHIPRHFTYYAGPEGVSETPDNKLGRFVSPVANTLQIEPQVVYDRTLRRFFAIHWRESDQRVRKGPELADDGRYEPVQIGWLWKNFIRCDVLGPAKPLFGPARSTSAVWGIQYLDEIPVLDASGRIDLLNLETLDVRETIAYLPMPITLLPARRSVAAHRDVAAYGVMPLQCRNSDARGIAIATLSREGLSLELEYFDANGLAIAGSRTLIPRYEEVRGTRNGAVRNHASEREAYSGLPGARMLTAAQFVLESLHPPVLVLSSYFGGPHFEATAGYRSVFLLPDSFVAMVARGGGDITTWERFLWASGYMLPGLLFFGVLAVKLDRDEIRRGTPRNARRAWIVATIALGLPAYVTYRLTRPTVALVTCANCGLGRRADFEKCQRCGAPWSVPELAPPTWRVLGEPEQVEVDSPSRAEEKSSSA